MVRRANKDAPAYSIHCQEKHRLIAAISVGISHVLFARLRAKYAGLTRNNYVGLIPIDSPDFQMMTTVRLFIDNASKKKKQHEVDRNARNLLEACQIPTNLDEYGLDLLPKIQDHLDTLEMRILFFNEDRSRRCALLEWSGPTEHPDVIVISQCFGQFKLLKSLNGLFDCFFCTHCLKADKRSSHRCEVTCRLCSAQGNVECNTGTENIHCEDCGFTFNSRQCHDRHKNINGRGRSSRCNVLKFCFLCKTSWNRHHTPTHDCERGNWCARCIRFHKRTEMCYWSDVTLRHKEKAKLRQSMWTWASWDTETIQSLPGEDPVPHRVNLIAVAWRCYLCHGKEEGFECVNCGTEREKVFKWRSADDEEYLVISEFLEFALHDKRMKNRVFYAHNSSRYDSHFLIRTLLKKRLDVRWLIDSRAIICITVKGRRVNHIEFRDSHKLITCSLADMARNLELDCGLKGIFPYLINHPNYYDYDEEGIPSEEFYGEMSGKKREEFEEMKRNLPEGYRFNMQEELIRYCKQDVRVLLDGIIKFSETFKEECGWCPFSNSQTIASFALFIHRYNYANASDMCLLPEMGMGFNSLRQSAMGLKWIAWLEHSLNRRLNHKLRGGGETCIEIEGKKMYVDAYDPSEDGGVCYEYNGCLIHACESCFPEGNEISPITGFTMATIRANNRRREQLLRSKHRLVVMYECQLKALIASDSTMATFFENCDVSENLCLQPRQCLSGGRVESWRYIQEAGPNDVIYYLDIVSLYPSCMYNNPFMVGEPHVQIRFTPEEVATIPFFGMLKAVVLPPSGLDIPLLPYRISNRLTFPLCACCARRNDERASCDHSDEERALSGVWTDIELRKALSLGYKIIRLDEVWHWPKEQWRDGIYSEYIKKFFRLKLISSGWPPQISNEEEREAYLERYRVGMGIEIRPEEIKLDRTKRYLCKLILNSLWGKMAQRDDLVTREFVDLEKLTELALNPSREVLLWHIFEDDNALVAHSPVDETRHSSRFAAIHHASRICSLGRLKLYELMTTVGRRHLLYNDTDSLVYICKNGEPNPLQSQLTGFLGQLSDEVPIGYYISKVVCNGPKSYAYRLLRKRGINEVSGPDEIEIVKSKGVFQNERTKDLSLEGLAKMVTAHLDPNAEPVQICVPQSNIIRPSMGVLKTVETKKRVAHVNNKCSVIGTDPYTAHRVPFGGF